MSVFRHWILLLLLGAVSCPAAVLLPDGVAWHWQLTESDPEPVLPGSWREPEYEGTTVGWSSGVAPLQRPAGTNGTVVPQGVGGLLARATFVVPAPDQYSTYRLKASVAGGAVVWLNGEEVLRMGVADGVDTPDQRPQPGTSIVRSASRGYRRSDLTSLRAGTNVMAVMVLAEGAATPLRWAASFEGDPDLAGPVAERVLPEPGSAVGALTEIEVLFDEPVRGVDAGDLLVNGVAAVDVVPLGPDQYAFTLPALGEGSVRVEWKSGAGIIDRAVPGNVFAGGAWTYTVTNGVAPDAVMISEFMADNDRTLRDENGDDVDWIELHNPTLQDVPLQGWGLSDDRNQPWKWRFPDVVIPGRGFLLVYASEKNRTNVWGRLHTNFKLDAGGEFLGLSDANGQWVSQFAPKYPAQSTDVSYGRANGAPSVVGYFEKPTPGAANSASGGTFAPGVMMSRPSGTYTGSITVALSLAAPDTNAVIRFTTNNVLPGPTSAVYAGPLTFTTAVHVRARAFSPGRLPGPPQSATYTPLAAQVAQFRSDLPVLMLHNYSRGRPSTAGVFGTVQLFEPTNGVTALTNLPTLSARAFLASRGSSTEGLPKVSLKVEFRDEFDLDRAVGWLGMPEDPDWVLYAPNVFDPIMTHNPFMHGLANDLGYYSSRCRFVEVYLVQSGLGAVTSTSYVGVYVLEEKVKRDKNRVDVDKLEPEHTLPPEVTGGYLFKVDRADPGDTGFSANGTQMMYVEPKEPEIERADRLAQRQYVTQFFTQFASALNGANYRNPTLGYARYLDVDPSIDFHILNTMAFNVDALVLSTYLYKPRNGKLTFGPLWDFDRALGSTDGRDSNPRTWGANFFTAYWWPRLFTDPDFTQRWIDRYQELRLGVLSTTNLFLRLDGLTAQLRQAQPRERAKWGTTYRGGSYTTEILYNKTWLSNRVDYMDTRFVPRIRPLAPELDAAAGQVQLRFLLPTNANLMAFYTTNGTDPRLSGGGISPSAQQYSAATPLSFDRNVRVIARLYSTTARSGTPNSRWGGPATSVLVVQRPPLRFTEVQYHPQDDGAAEYLEIFNPSDTAVSLQGWQLAGGVQFVFGGTNAFKVLDPRQRCVVVSDVAAFGTVPAGVLVAGQFMGRLANSGDRVELIGPVGEVVDAIHYDDAAEPLADGGGWTLVPRNESELGATVWKLSAGIGGSPGTPDLASDAGPGGDTDSDGLPDVWERFHGLIVGEAATDMGWNDRDGDGVSNRGEFLAGTDPKSAASVLRMTATPGVGNALRLSWNRVPGRSVRVLVRSAIGGVDQILVDVPARGTAGMEEWTGTLGDGDRFYRLTAP